jgi:hypothetical protein
MMFGPQWVGAAGFTASVDAPTGIVHVALACGDQVETLAAAHAEEKDILGKGGASRRQGELSDFADRSAAGPERRCDHVGWRATDRVQPIGEVDKPKCRCSSLAWQVHRDEQP